jgi:hypothetical protein
MFGVDMENTALKQEGETDFLLVGNSVWVSVGNVSVYVRKGDQGVTVDLFPLGCAEMEPAASTYLEYLEALEVVEGSNEDGAVDDLVNLHKERIEQAVKEVV